MLSISKGFKIQLVQFESVHFSVTLTSEDAGLPPPDSVESLRDLASQLSYQAEALVAIELVKLGRVHTNQLAERLKPWLPRSSSSPTTGQG